MQLRENRFFSVAHGFQLDNGVTSPGGGKKKLVSLVTRLLQIIITSFLKQ